MTTEDTINNNDDEINILDIWNFLLRQYKTIFMTLMIIIVAILSYALSRPTIYQSKSSLIIGNQLYFPQPLQLIESTDEIQYRYSSQATISPVKKTNIVEVIATANNPDIAEANLKLTLETIISTHNAILDEKKSMFESLLASITNSSNINKSELIHLLDNASSSSQTKQLTNIETKELKYNGTFLKTFSIGTILALIISFLFATVKDYIDRNKY